MSEADTVQQRKIRSFVLRTGRMTDAQKQALARHWTVYGLEPEDGRINPAEIFQREAPLVVEIGFGMGDSLVEMADSARDCNFIGIEVHTPGVGRLLNQCAERQLSNLRVYNADAVGVLNDCLPVGGVDRLQIYFPDPWPKARHHKRRLIQAAFVQQLRRALRIGGVLHLATDWEHYAEQMLAVMSAADGFANCAEDYCFAEKPDYRPTTKFEHRGEKLGHGVWDILFQRES